MTVNTAAGATIFIGGTNLASNQTEYEADSYTEVGEVEDMGEFGDESEEITFAALKDGRVRKFKGPRDAGTMTVVVGDDQADEGQAAMEAAEASPLDYNFKVVLNDAVTLGGTDSIHYFHGKVMSKRRNVGNVSNIVRRTFNVGVNSEIITVPPT